MVPTHKHSLLVLEKICGTGSIGENEVFLIKGRLLQRSFRFLTVQKHS